MTLQCAEMMRRRDEAIQRCDGASVNTQLTKRELYRIIVEIISSDDDFPTMQAKNLEGIAQEDGRFYLVFYLLLVALRVKYWRNRAAKLKEDAKNIEDNAGMLEDLNTGL